MSDFVIVYSTANNRTWQSPNWRTAAEKPTLAEARKVFENFKVLAEEKATDYCARPGQLPITQVAVFALRGGETFQRKPHLYADYRDKSGWPLGSALGALVNSVNSDFTINRRAS